MPSLIHLRRKIKSVKNTKQITRAMQMVAASKMRRAQEAVAGTRAYAEAGYGIMTRLQQVLAAQEKTVSMPLLTQRPIHKIALIVVSSDRGLAGAYNVNVLKKAVEFLETHQDKEVDIIVIGKKAQEGLARFGYKAVASFVDFPGRPNSTDMRAIAKLSIDEYVAGNYDQVAVVYTRFYSTLKQTAEVQQILPIAQEQTVQLDGESEAADAVDYLFEPEASEVLQYIVPRMIEIQLLQTVLESIASEHSSRMLAMKNATDNASDLIGDLTLTYNGVRQANITQEIAEISAGSNI